MKRAYVDTPEGQVHYQFGGSGEPLILLHQGMFSSDEFSKLTPELTKYYRCLAPDMLGYGMSDVNEPDLPIEGYVSNTINFMKAVGVSKADFIGIHTGSTIAIYIAATHPEMVKRIVVYGLPSFAPAVREACLKSYSFSPVEIKEDGSHLINRLWKTAHKLGIHASPEDLNSVVVASAMAKGGAFHAEHAIFKYNEQKHWPLVKAPTLIISGTDDAFHARIEEIKGKIPGSRIAVMENVDGFVILERPDEFTRLALDFLKQKTFK